MTRPSRVEERAEADGSTGDVVVRVDRRTNRVALVVVPVAILLCLGILSSLNILPRLHNPFSERTVDRSQPVLLQSIQDLSRYEAASGNFQVVVDLERDAKFLPDFVRGQRTLFVGAGSVDAYVDFSLLGKDGVTVSGDGNRVDVRLPRAQLERAALDTGRSYVFAQQRGLLDRIGAFFSSNPDSQRQVYALAQTKIEQAAEDTELTARAEQNTRTMLEGMLRSLGFREVTVRFADQP
jgi:Protein of unknown function (DUF4230)